MRKCSSRAFLYPLVIPIIVLIRGRWLASSIGGRYPWGDWFVDSLGFAVLIGLLIGVDALLRRFEPKAGRRAATIAYLTFRVGILLGVFFPFLLATLQIHPQRIATAGTPADWDLPYEEVRFPSRGDQLHGWHCPQETPKAAVLVAHGLNANRENFLQPVQMLHDLGHAVLIFDFPGHGDSEGRRTTLGYLEEEDVRQAHAWLTGQYPGLSIHALGYSMGASAVLTAAGKHDIFDKVAVDSTFASVRHVANAAVLKYAGPAKGWLWHSGCFWIRLWTGADLNAHRPIDHLSGRDPTTLLIIHGTADPIIPFEEGEALFEQMGHAATFHQAEGYGHAETIHHPEYREWLRDFFE